MLDPDVLRFNTGQRHRSVIFRGQYRRISKIAGRLDGAGSAASFRQTLLVPNVALLPPHCRPVSRRRISYRTIIGCISLTEAWG